MTIENIYQVMMNFISISLLAGKHCVEAINQKEFEKNIAQIKLFLATLLLLSLTHGAARISQSPSKETIHHRAEIKEAINR